MSKFAPELLNGVNNEYSSKLFIKWLALIGQIGKILWELVKAVGNAKNLDHWMKISHKYQYVQSGRMELKNDFDLMNAGQNFS